MSQEAGRRNRRIQPQKAAAAAAANVQQSSYADSWKEQEKVDDLMLPCCNFLWYLTF
jgi:hypothetical protein